MQYYYVCVLILMYVCHRTSSCTNSQIFTSESVAAYACIRLCPCRYADITSSKIQLCPLPAAPWVSSLLPVLNFVLCAASKDDESTRLIGGCRV